MEALLLGVDVTMSAQAGVGIFVNPRLAHCVNDWIPLGGKVCSLKLGLQEWSLCILQVYAPNAETQYHPFLDEVGVVLQKVTSAKSIVLLGDFDAHVLTTGHGRVLSEDKEIPTLTETKGVLLQFCATNELYITNTFFWHKSIHKCIYTSDLQYTLDRFSDACLDAEMKISTYKTDIMCLLRHPVQFSFQINGVTLY